MNDGFYIGKNIQARLIAKGGAFHWLMQRITAVLLIPLPFWTVFFIKYLSYSSYEELTAWLSTPLNSVFLVLTALVAGYHAVLGMQSIFDDYVHRESYKTAAMWAVKLVFLLTLLSVLAAVWLIGSME